VPGRLIAFSGVDCAGKTTQIELLVRALERRSERPRVLWFRPGYSRELDALRALIRRLRPGALPTVAQPEQRQQAFARPAVQKTWLAMAGADIVLQLALKVRALVLTGHSVVCDRYLPDALLDLELRFPELVARHRRALEAAVQVCPVPDRWFLLNLPKDEMLRRMELKREPFPDAPEVRDARFAAYQTMTRRSDVIVVDAAQSIDSVHRAVIEQIF
jgi:thymidylate kinase